MRSVHTHAHAHTHVCVLQLQSNQTKHIGGEITKEAIEKEKKFY